MIWLGIILIIVAFGLIIGELFTGSGILLLSGIAALVFGLLSLFWWGSLSFQVNWWLAVPLIILFLALIGFIVWRIVRTHRNKITTGKEDLVGSTAVVKEELAPEGTVLVEGELWDALSQSGHIKEGEEVIVTRVEKLRLLVTRKTGIE